MDPFRRSILPYACIRSHCETGFWLEEAQGHSIEAISSSVTGVPLFGSMSRICRNASLQYSVSCYIPSLFHLLLVQLLINSSHADCCTCSLTMYFPSKHCGLSTGNRVDIRSSFIVQVNTSLKYALPNAQKKHYILLEISSFLMQSI